ncbi:hypothetical protein AB0I22_02435 [Streptomyces sp. NPDC050610]|uniref:hypothetical protein n=1 Tax=Streptomyces sp. NPDC050610 TaxID=3157097 RepID=UPI00341C43E6
MTGRMSGEGAAGRTYRQPPGRDVTGRDGFDRYVIGQGTDGRHATCGSTGSTRGGAP